MDAKARASLLQAIQKAYEEDKLEEKIRAHWAAHVPSLITPGPQPIKLQYDDDQLSALLLEPLEAFIMGTLEVDNKFDALKKNDIPTFLCNRSFRAGEPTYSCRDCAVDATCVLCIECFKQSTHKNHRYKISSSSGGGYCDCGDPEAWKKDCACSQHEPPDGAGPPSIDVDDAKKRLPRDIVRRCHAVIPCALSYAYQLLCLRDGEGLSDDLLSPKRSDKKLCFCNDAVISRWAFYRAKSEEEEGYEFATVLYNDETHTYEQVISTLCRTLECNHEEALEYATVVDHEGRSPVKFGSYADCERVKNFIERNSRRPQPLRVDIIPTLMYAHQVFALKVMNWIQKLADSCEGFKALICEACLQAVPITGEMPLVSALLLKDVRLWKAARGACHALFMATFLTFNDAKIEFSRLFARLYPQLMTAFISDDHEHSDSCTSLSVQLFTVPSVARTLFADKLVEVIIKSFVLICQSRRNDLGRLSFDRTTQPGNSTQFKRALYTLYDTRYLLNTVPTPDLWTPGLRKGFIGAFEQFLQIMIMMEGMDFHTRRTQSHIEYETDWEPAFNVQLRMGPLIDMLQSWCASDDKVLATCIEKLTVAAIDALSAVEKWEKKEVAGVICECIEYDVGSQAISIHHPVVRMLAGLVTSGLSRSLTVQPFNTRQALGDCVNSYARELMEFPLRTLVLVAQASAGMWRRNGYALANQIFFYQQPRCREEMLDKDVLMMQACAAVMKADEFLINIINKFGLVHWADETFDATPLRTDGDDSIRQTLYLAEEFFYCLMVFIGERYYPGLGKVTEDDCLKNEIIHQLSIQNMSYSELVKNLPEQEAKASTLDDVVRDVAVFKRPSAASKGYFELKPEFTSHYNMFFYHYSRIEHSKAEDTQRKRKKKDGEEPVFPPPCPPEFTDAFRNVIHVMDCDVFIHLMNLTLRRALSHHPRSFSEGQLVRVLFLIGYALHEEKRARDQQKTDYKFMDKAVDVGIFATLRELRNQKESEAYRALIEWILQFYETLTKVEEDKPAEPMDVAENVVSTTPEPAASDDIEERRRRAAARRDRIMQQMKQAQSSFAIQNVGELQEIALPDDHSAKAAVTPTAAPVESLLVLGAERNVQRADLDLEEKLTCILCSESHVVNLTADAFVAVAYVQRSTVLSQADRKHLMDEFMDMPAVTVKDLCQKLMGNPLFMPDTMPCAPHVSSCGHLLHAKCWKTYFESVVARERRRSIRLRTNAGSFDVTKNEFRCPLCSRLCNAAIPLFPPVGQKENMDVVGGPLLVPSLNTFTAALAALLVVQHKPGIRVASEDEALIGTLDDAYQQALAIRVNFKDPAKAASIAKIRDIVAVTERLQGIDVKNSTDVVSDAHVEAVRTFQNQVFQMSMNASSPAQSEELCISLNWAACSYSVQTIEMCLRYENKSLLGSFSSRQYLCLKCLTRASCWSSSAYETKVLTEHAVKLFSALFNPLSSRNVLDMDAFSLLINCTHAFPWLPWSEEGFTAPYVDAPVCRLPVGDSFDHHLLVIVYLLHILQVFKSVSYDIVERSDSDASHSSSKDPTLRKLYAAFVHRLSGSDVTVQVPPNLERIIQERTWPFLRCCAIFYHFITGIPASEALKAEGQTSESESADLMAYLGLPNSVTVLLDENPALNDLVHRWIFNVGGPGRSGKISLPHPFPSFAPLPHDYTDVINRASQNSGCRVEADDRRSPAMCLVCGALLCSQSMCCQYKLDNQTVGACAFHAAICGAGTGIFLRVRENQVLMLHGTNKGCFGASPYVDAYGEPDPFLRRGNPLHLSVERLEQLHRHYMHHDVADEVSHAMDQNGTLAGFDWFHF
ncbi:E3 ubiquitin-protein ligase UBR2-like isoform X2 [Paramacrobiotus metropolitanus]|uniref:E3 ubiquitin-protein ligase UBR2-like isoform X2 n=1 Tax=Paramacrobiotus metropolitanus TaxID=2943436 RepID=UPI0024461B36|nr:E3 ubiquitin-protein ligase UBR2-like isoform X2 [Paramacrobiotus metropolitanus]